MNAIQPKQSRVKQSTFRFSPIFLALITACLPAYGDDYFESGFLGVDAENVDLSVFSKEGGAVEGEYLVTVIINNQVIGQKSVLFRRLPDGNLSAVLTPAYLQSIGVNIPQIEKFKGVAEDAEIDDIREYIPNASTRLDLSQLKVDISVPQIAMTPNFRGYISPDLWDDGIPALSNNYNMSYGTTKTSGNAGNTRSKNFYASVRSVLSLGAWRVKTNFNYSHSESGNQKYTNTDFNNTYVTRDIIPLLSTIFIGEYSTGNDIFDGIPFKGASIRTNEQMLPQQMRGYAPAVSGVANSNARVTIRQNGNVVYETYVAPGPFDIRDIQQAGVSGDLDVTVTESDGSERKFIVPYSSIAVMLRPGRWNYEVAAGEYNGGSTVGSRKDKFILGTLAYGFMQNFTLFGGVVGSQNYQSGTLGTGVSLGSFGAISADVTLSESKFDDVGSKSGQSYRLRYSKSVLATGTAVDLVALRYSTENYFSFSEYNTQGYRLKDDVNPWSMQKRRSSIQGMLSQTIGTLGSIYLRANRDEFWGTNRTLTGGSVGFSSSYKGVGYSINYNIDRMKDDQGNWPENKQLSLNVSVPFSIFSYAPGYQSVYSNYSMTHDNKGRTSHNAGVSGSLLNGDVSYSAMQSWGNQQQISNTNLNLGYQGTKGYVNTGYNYSKDSQSFNTSLSGGVLLHSRGAVFANTLGETMALVEAPEAKGLKLTDGRSDINRWGYGVMTQLTPYQFNSVGIDPTTLPEGVDIVKTNESIYPTQGAVVKVKFATRVGYQLLVSLQKGDGYVPFGGVASYQGQNDLESISGIVGDDGQVYLSGLPESGVIEAKWGSAPDQQCSAPFTVSSQPENALTDIRQISVKCE
ncbi:fimbrial biogenesis outer membrane usher protein [Providencia rettgeri]|nr:fimbrial biogenesis outer membrane usher protein [Providencia rettgeri]